jgi:VanZ family protein
LPESSGRAQAGFAYNVVPALVYAALVFWAGSIELPAPPFEPPVLSWDKLGHVLAFALMQLVWWRAIRHELPRLGPRTQSLLAAGVAGILGGILELYQGALPHRSADLYDFGADLIGAGLAALLLVKRLQARPQSLAASSNLTNE